MTDQSARFADRSSPAIAIPTSSVPTGVATQDSETPPRGYHERLAGGWCTYGACPRRAEGWPDPAHAHCQRHRVQVQARQRKQKRSARKQLAAAGKCVRCRKPSKTYRCPACRIADQTVLPTSSVSTGVDTTGDQWRRDNDGWQRYRGKGRRGAPGAAANDEMDLAAAFKALERGREAMVYAHSPGVASLGRIARSDARKAAAHLLALAARFIDDVVTRYTGEPA